MSEYSEQISKFSDPNLVKKLVANIKETSNLIKSKNNKQINLMEVCGTHTMAIAQFGIRQLLPDNINLISGPGCPVCVTPNLAIDEMLCISQLPNVTVLTFGDMMKVPGTSSSLQDMQAKGCDIRVVYSPLQALDLAKEMQQSDPERKVVFLGVGFETTAPLSAVTIMKAKEQGLTNFSLFCAHKNMPNALQTIVVDKTTKIDGFILPGHVSTIIGEEPYKFLATQYNMPGVITGFEPVDILLSINSLLKQIQANSSFIQNNYSRGVKAEGNPTAMSFIDKVFDVCDSNWRGLGKINDSGYIIKQEYSQFDAQNVFDLGSAKIISKEPKGCKCGDVLKGIITPKECPLFSKKCTPQYPVGPCMVSNEGTCRAFYKYKI